MKRIVFASILLFLFLTFVQPIYPATCVSSPCTVLSTDGPIALEDAFVNIGTDGVILLPDCNYVINSTTVFNSNNGTFFGFPMSYLAINDANVTVNGNSDGLCPNNRSEIIFLQDNVPDPSFVQYIPFGIRVMHNDTTLLNLKLRFEIDLDPYDYDEPLNGTDYSYITFISETLCPFGTNGDCTLDEYTIGTSFDSWFPAYDTNDVAPFSSVINGFRMLYSEFDENQNMAYTMIAMGPISMCNYTVSYNYFHNTYTLFPFQYDFNNPNIEVCPGYDSPPYDNGHPLMDMRLNCFDHTEAEWCTLYDGYYTCLEVWTNVWLNQTDPNTPPDPIWLPYADCPCGYRPSPLFTYYSNEIPELVGFLTLQSYLDDPSTYDGTLHLGAQYITVDETLVVSDKSFLLVGNTDPASCDCPIGLLIDSNTNPGFLIMENLMCISHVDVFVRNNATAFLFRGADELHVGQNTMFENLVGVSPDTTITQAYTVSSLTECTYLARDSHFNQWYSDDADNRGIVSLEGDEADGTFNLIAFNTFRNLDIHLFSAYGSLDVHDNLFTNLNDPSWYNSTAIVLGHEAVNSRIVDNVFSGFVDAIAFMGGHANNVTCNIFINNTNSDIIFRCGGSDVYDFEEGSCPDFVCHYVTAAVEYFQLHNRQQFLNELSYPGISYEETDYEKQIENYLIGVYNGTVPECEENLLFLFYELMQDSVQLNTCIFKVIYGDPGSCTLTFSDIELIFSTLIQLYDATECCPPVDPCTTVEMARRTISKREALNHMKHNGFSRLVDIPDCFSSIDNIVVNNYHYGPLWETGDVVSYPDASVLAQNTIDTTYGFAFSGGDLASDVLVYAEFPPNTGSLFTYTFGFNPSNNSATIDLESIEGNAIDDDSPVRFLHGTYVENWQEPCRADDAQPYLLSVFDDFTRLGQNATDVDSCTSCVVTFTINSTLFDQFYADNDIELTCTDVSVITLVAPFQNIWVEMDTTRDCDDSDGFYEFSSNCTGSTAHYAVGPPPRSFYVECEGGTPFMDGIPVYDLETALLLSTPGSTIYLSDGTCCADEIVAVNKTNVHITSFWDDCHALVSCCADPAEIAIYGNGVCDFVLAIAYGSSGFTIDKINWVNINAEVVQFATAVYVNPPPVFLQNYIDPVPAWEILSNVTIHDNTFTNTTVADIWGACANCSFENNQVGTNVVAPCSPLTTDALPVTYEWASQHKIDESLPHARKLKDHLSATGHSERLFAISNVVNNKYYDSMEDIVTIYTNVKQRHDKYLATRKHTNTTAKQVPIKNTKQALAPVVQPSPVQTTPHNAIIDRIEAARHRNAATRKKGVAKLSGVKTAPVQQRLNKMGRLVSSPYSEFPCVEYGIIIDPTLPAEYCAQNNQNNYGITNELSVNITNNLFTDLYKAIYIGPLDKSFHEPISTPIQFNIHANQCYNTTGVCLQIEQSESMNDDDKFIVGLNYFFFCGHNALGSDISAGHVSMDANTFIECPSTVFGSDIHIRQNAFITSTVAYTDSSSYSGSTKAVDQGGNSVTESIFLNSSLVHVTTNGVRDSHSTKHNSGIKKASHQITRAASNTSVTTNSEDRDCTQVIDNLFDKLMPDDDTKTIVSQWTKCSAVFHYLCTSGNINGNGDPIFEESADSCIWDLDGKSYCLGNTTGAYIYRSKAFPPQCGVCNCEDNQPYKNGSTDFYPGGVCPPISQIYSPMLTEYGTGVSVFLTCGTQNETSDFVLCPSGLKRGDDGKCSIQCDAQDDDDDDDSSSSSSSSNGDHGSNFWWIIICLGLVFLIVLFAALYISGKSRAEERAVMHSAMETYNQNLMMGGGTPPPQY